MRLLLLVISALAASSMQVTHGNGFRGLRAMESSNPKCTAAQTKAFTDSISAASSGCLVSTSYVWDGYADPTDGQRGDLCKCTVSPFNVPKCYFTKLGQYNIDVSVHFGFVYNCQSINGKSTPKVTEVDSVVTTPSPTPTPTSTPTPTPTTPTPTTAAPTTASTDTAAPKASTPATTTTNEASTSEKLPDCTVQQLSAFKSALNIASGGCMGGSSSTYDWGGNANPTNDQYSEICKCVSVGSFAIPSCSIQKGPDTVSLPVHYNWVLSTQCPSFSPTSTSSSSGNKSSISIGMIGGIAGGVVLVMLIIIFVLCKRNRKGKHEETRANVQANAAPSPAPTVGYQAIPETSQNARSRKNTEPRPSAISDGSRSTISTTNGSLLPSATGSAGSKASARTPETATWNDPAITAVRIPFDSIFLGSLINRGGFGEVYRGTYKGETVAIKQLLPARRKDLEQIDHFLGEVKLMSTLEHERIVKFIGVAWNSLSDACMVMEFMENGDLRSVLTRWDEGPERRMNGFDADKVKIAMHIAHALVYLHSLQPVVVHRDLKSKNILLDASFDAKLMDFGISRERADSTMTAGVGSSLWMAPEVMMGNRYDEKADIFSFGVVLSELDTHQLPYFHAKAGESGQKVPDAAILQQAMLGRITVAFTDRANGELVRLGRECVSLDPKERPTTAMVLHRVHQVMRQYKS